MLTAGGEQVNRDQWRLDETAQPSKGSGRAWTRGLRAGRDFQQTGSARVALKLQRRLHGLNVHVL